MGLFGKRKDVKETGCCCGERINRNEVHMLLLI